MPGRGRRRRPAWRGGLRGRHVAIDDVLPLADRGAARRRDQWSTETKHNVPVLPVFMVTSAMREVRVASSPTRKRIEEFQLAAGPHPARQRHRRQEAAAGGMAVGAEFRHRKDRLRQAPMHGARARHRPVLGSPISRNSVARRPFTSCAVTMSEACVLRPIHWRRWSRSGFSVMTIWSGNEEISQDRLWCARRCRARRHNARLADEDGAPARDSSPVPSGVSTSMRRRCG